MNTCTRRQQLLLTFVICRCHRAGLQPLESFLTKAIQLYEMIVVRHGLMLVGQSYGMKTAAYRMLAGALTGEPPCLLAPRKLHAQHIACQGCTSVSFICTTRGSCLISYSNSNQDAGFQQYDDCERWQPTDVYRELCVVL
jgi:hypothetical protein